MYTGEVSDSEGIDSSEYDGLNDLGDDVTPDQVKTERTRIDRENRSKDEYYRDYGDNVNPERVTQRRLTIHNLLGSDHYTDGFYEYERTYLNGDKKVYTVFQDPQNPNRFYRINHDVPIIDWTNPEAARKSVGYTALGIFVGGVTNLGVKAIFKGAIDEAGFAAAFVGSMIGIPLKVSIDLGKSPYETETVGSHDTVQVSSMPHSSGHQIGSYGLSGRDVENPGSSPRF